MSAFDDFKEKINIPPMPNVKKPKEQEPKTITQILEDVSNEMCESYCKYTHMEPPEGKDENWLTEDDESPCIMCPLNRL